MMNNLVSGIAASIQDILHGNNEEEKTDKDVSMVLEEEFASEEAEQCLKSLFCSTKDDDATITDQSDNEEKEDEEFVAQNEEEEEQFVQQNECEEEDDEDVRVPQNDNDVMEEDDEEFVPQNDEFNEEEEEEEFVIQNEEEEEEEFVAQNEDEEDVMEEDDEERVPQNDNDVMEEDEERVQQDDPGLQLPDQPPERIDPLTQEHPKRLHKSLGVHSKISAILKNVRPLEPIRKNTQTHTSRLIASLWSRASNFAR